jgi:hypothetical protein
LGVKLWGWRLWAEQFGAVFWRERLGFSQEGGLSGFVELGRGRGAGGDGDADLLEEFFFAGRRADTEESDRLIAGIDERVRGIGRDVDGLAGFHGSFFAAESGLDLALEDCEGLLKIMPVRWRAATWRDVHVDQAVSAVGVFACQQKRIGVADQADVWKRRVCFRLGEFEITPKVVGWDWSGWSRGD